MKMLKTTLVALAAIAGVTAGAVQADSVSLVKTYGMLAITPYHVSASKHNFFRPDFDQGKKIAELDRQHGQLGSAVYDENKGNAARAGSSKGNPYTCDADTIPPLLNSPG